MPNLQPPLTSLEAVCDYRQRILNALCSEYQFTPYMTLYLNEHVNPDDLQKIKNHSFILGAKLYPAGVTTNSAAGARSISALYPLFEIMQAENVVLQIHGEVLYGDIFKREALFLQEHLAPLVHNFPKLRMVVEHISTKTAVEFIEQAPDTIAATITPHHLLYNRNHLLAGGIKPHFYCLPILKREQDQRALLQAACSGNPKFFAGTDSAPHAQRHKETACGCAGIYSAPFAVAMYAQAFAESQALKKLDAFMSHMGANFYQVPISLDRIEIFNHPYTIPASFPLGKETVVPVAAGTTLEWSVHDS